MRNCIVCNHELKATIEAALVAGTSVAEVARRYGVHRSAVTRHRENHGTDPALVALASARPDFTPAPSDEGGVAEDRPPVEQLIEKLRQTEELRLQATERNNIVGALQATRQASQLVEDIARLRGLLAPPPPAVIDLASHPEWVTLRSAILSVFATNPNELVTRHALGLELAAAIG
ncbi:MAG: hypothetical protein ACYDGR_03610 [Candidatus Dormibacteria bacterium]